MKNNTRIPSLSKIDIDGVSKWFNDMSDEGLLFHPDDPPDSICRVDTGEILFSTSECSELEEIIDEIFCLFGDEVYVAAYQIFMGTIGID